MQMLEFSLLFILAPCLLSASMDKTLIVWEYDEENELWMDKVCNRICYIIPDV